ncbi:MAG: DNA polymerase [Planctomycetota bacterium]
MSLAAIDFEFGFGGRAFDYTTVVAVCAVIYFADGKSITACPSLGRPWSVLTPYLENPDIQFAMHHGAFAERRILNHLGLPFPEGHWFDTELAERVFHIVNRGDRAQDKPVKDEGPYTLLNCLRRRGFQVRESEVKKAMQKKIGTLTFSDAELSDIVGYCAEDCVDTLRLAQAQLEDFKHLPGTMSAIYTGLLQPHLLRVADMTSKGLLFDVDSYRILKANEEKLLAGMQAELKSLGFQGQFNHIHEKLTVAPQNLNVVRTFETLGFTHILEGLSAYKSDRQKPIGGRRRHLSGVFKEGHKSKFPFIRAVKDYHDLIELFKMDWEQYIDSDGKIRPAVSFPGTSSYRTQQLMPNPLMLPYFARPLFHAAPGEALLEKDFKCQEMGLSADHYGDPKLLEIYNNFELCLYCEIGAAMGMYPRESGKPADPGFNPALRAVIKTALLAMQYGGTEKALMGQLNISRAEATRIITAFWQAFPDLAEGRSLYLEHIRRNGIAVNRAGLMRGYRPFTRKEGRCHDSALSYLNYPVQSSGAAVLMLALADLPAWVNPVLTMHDAIQFQGPIDAIQEMARAAERSMATAMQTLYPRMRCRSEAQAAWRYFKKSPASLHEFAAKFGIKLKMEVGWCAPKGFLD